MPPSRRRYPSHNHGGRKPRSCAILCLKIPRIVGGTGLFRPTMRCGRLRRSQELRTASGAETVSTSSKQLGMGAGKCRAGANGNPPYATVTHLSRRDWISEFPSHQWSVLGDPSRRLPPVRQARSRCSFLIWLFGSFGLRDEASGSHPCPRRRWWRG